MLAEANFPYVNANVFRRMPSSALMPMADRLERQQVHPPICCWIAVKDKGRQSDQVGILGLTAQVLQWDKRHLEGKMVVADMVETANHYVPELRAKGPNRWWWLTPASMPAAMKP